MKFRSVTGKDVQIGLTSGHTAIVTPQGVELEQRFHREAIARGCLPGDMPEPTQEAPSQFNRKQVITDAINAMLAGSEPDDFTKHGKPDLRKLNAKVGFNVERSEADALWDEISKA